LIEREGVQSSQELAPSRGNRCVASPVRERLAREFAVADEGRLLEGDELELRDRRREDRGELGQQRSSPPCPFHDFGPTWKAEDPFIVDLDDATVPAALHRHEPVER
jgi:hypothetical protein